MESTGRWRSLRVGIDFVREALRETAATFRHLAVVMVPVIIAVKVLQEAGLIEVLATPLTPVTNLVGLPPSLGLVWATAMFNNIYTAMVVFVSIAGSEPVTQAQTTVLATMILVAHNLPVELGIARRAGAAIGFQILTRVGGAVALGWLLHLSYAGLGVLGDPVRPLFTPDSRAGADTLQGWALDQVVNLAGIFGIILVLVCVMRVLERLRLTERVVGLLLPVLKGLGLGRTSTPLTIVGLVMGIAYGGGLIIKESLSGRVRPRDGFMAVTLLGLTHSVVEDSLLMVALGAHLSGILWGRMVFTAAVVVGLSRLLSHLPSAFVHRFLYLDRHLGPEADSASKSPV